MVIARFEIDVEGGTPHRTRRAPDGFGLGMRPSEVAMVPPADDDPVLHDHASDHRIWTHATGAISRERQTFEHV